MAKQKSLDYILGMITGASIMLAAWTCTNGKYGTGSVSGE